VHAVVSCGVIRTGTLRYEAKAASRAADSPGVRLGDSQISGRVKI
jgi:hypothetical protein